MNRKMPLWLVLLLLWCLFVIAIIYGTSVWYFTATKKDSKTAHAVIFFASLPAFIKESFTEINQGSLLKRPNFYPAIKGFRMEHNYLDSNYVLLAAYDIKKNQSAIKLIRIRDQEIIYQWVPDFDKVTKYWTNDNTIWQPADKHSLRIVHPLLALDGSIIFHNSLSPLIKLDKRSKVVWAVKGTFDHSLEFDADGNIWVQSAGKNPGFYPKVLKEYIDNYLNKITPNGRQIFKKSVSEILVENGYEGLLLGSAFEPDVLHVNDIQPALSSTEYWKKGDLLVSVRHKSTVFLYRPSSNKIIWLKTGPWLNQHDVDFIDDSRIGVFGNDIVRNVPGIEGQLLNGFNQEYVYDFKTGKVTTPYTEVLKKAKVSTSSEGRSDILPNGDLFIEESNKNRLLRVNKKDVLWQYVNRIDQHTVGAIEWTRFITKAEFNKLTFLHKN